MESDARDNRTCRPANPTRASPNRGHPCCYRVTKNFPPILDSMTQSSHVGRRSKTLTFTLNRRELGVALLGAAASGLSGCAARANPDTIVRNSIRLQGTLVEPPIARPSQILSDTKGRPFSFRDRPNDELTVLFFGYTRCPDFCPTTAADLAQARREMPAGDARRIQTVFVTEDPRVDTPQVVQRWLRAFDPTFVGLIGGNAASASMLRSVYSQQTSTALRPRGGDSRTVDHTSVVYGFGPGGISVIWTGAPTASMLKRDFRILLGRD